MKKVILMFLTLGLSTSAFAGNATFTCKSSDGATLISREHLVSISKDDYTKQVELAVFANADSNMFPAKESTLEFTNESGNKVVSLKMNSILSRKVIAKNDSSDCGPGFVTEAYKIKGQISSYGGKPEAIELSCVESSYWGGHCFGN